ncbi:hypothetical protein LWS67_00095 [Bacillus atrophaeus]|uniref:hypothetical protein n=1 Tax=Bacillus atrophaeus TaxID=1452 RepID=UPI001EFB1A4B|nr:hypothetical protein [Bacillus atrophaeus]MCG8395045.1 hypothetical protein [Bacillus atrophaeus]
MNKPLNYTHFEKNKGKHKKERRRNYEFISFITQITSVVFRLALWCIDKWHTIYR